MGKFYLERLPPYCRPFECGDIYPYINLFQSLSYVVTEPTAANPTPDTIKTGFDKINSNFAEVETAFETFADAYGRYRQNTNLTYHISTINYDALTANNGLHVGDVLYFAPSSVDYPNGCWSFAYPTSGAESEALGVVTRVWCPEQESTPGGCFVLTLNGYVSAAFDTPRIPGSTYFLTTGAMSGKTAAYNTLTPNHVSKPIYTAITSTEIVVDIKRGVLVAPTQVW